MQLNDIASTPEVQALVAESESLADDKTALVVTDTAGYAIVAHDLKRAKDALDKLVTLRKTFTDPLDKARAAVMDWFRGPEAKLKQAEAAFKASLLDYDRREDERRAAEQSKLDEAARKQRDKLIEQANKAEAAGKTERADEFRARAAMVVAPIVQVERADVTGISTRENWSAEVVDLPALVRAVADGKAPRACLKADEKFLNAQARSLRTELDYPGVRAVGTRGLAARRQ